MPEKIIAQVYKDIKRDRWVILGSLIFVVALGVSGLVFFLQSWKDRDKFDTSQLKQLEGERIQIRQERLALQEERKAIQERGIRLDASIARVEATIANFPSVIANIKKETNAKIETIRSASDIELQHYFDNLKESDIDLEQ